MLFKPAKLVTIIAEKTLSDRLSEGVLEHGANGFTLTDATGSGSRGLRTFELDGKNIRLEVICSAPTAERIVQWVSETFFRHYAITMYLQDVEVVRGEKYS